MVVTGALVVQHESIEQYRRRVPLYICAVQNKYVPTGPMQTARNSQTRTLAELGMKNHYDGDDNADSELAFEGSRPGYYSTIVKHASKPYFVKPPNDFYYKKSGYSFMQIDGGLPTYILDSG